MLVEIINGDHTPPWPFMVVGRVGMHVDFTNVQGQLWDAPTVAKVTWGNVHPGNGRTYGTVVLKNGTIRPFWDENLIKPYLAAYRIREADEIVKAKAAAKKKQQAATAAMARKALVPSTTPSTDTDRRVPRYS